MAQQPDFNFNSHPEILQAYQRQAEQKMQQQQMANQQKQQQFESTMQAAQAASQLVQSFVESSKQRQQRDAVKSYLAFNPNAMTTRATGEQTGTPLNVPASSSMVPGSFPVGQPMDVTTQVPYGQTPEGQQDLIQRKARLSSLFPQETAQRIIDQQLPSPQNQLVQEQKRTQMANTQETLDQKKRLDATGGPLHDTLSAQAKDLGVTNTDSLTVKDLQDAIASNVKITSAQAQEKRGNAYERTNQLREEQFTEKQWNGLSKAINGLGQGQRSAVGMAAVGNQRAARALEILNNPEMTPQLLDYVNTDLGGIMQGGSPHVEQLNRSDTGRNAVVQWAKLKQQILSKPESVDLPETRQLLKDTITGIMAVDNDVLDTNIGIEKEGYLKAIKTDPDRFDRMVKAADKIKTVGSNARPTTNTKANPQMDALAQALGLKKKGQ